MSSSSGRRKLGDKPATSGGRTKEEKMALSRPWRIVAGAGAAAVIAGVGGVAYATDRINLTDRRDPAPVETVELVDDGLEINESVGDSPFDSADTVTSPTTPASPASAASVASP